MRFGTLLLPTGLLVGALTQTLGAQTTCIPQALGVPALSGPPRWWDSPTDGDAVLTFPTEMERLDDPRWRGAVSHSLNNGEVEFRAIYKPDSVFLSWRISIDQTLNANEDQIWLGVKDNSGAAFVFQLILSLENAPLDAAPQGTTDPLAFKVYKYVGSTPQLVNPGDPNYPAWLDALTRAWTRRISASASWWAMQVVIPIKSTGLKDGLDIVSPFQMWYTAFVVPQAGADAVEYRWPSTLPRIYDDLNQQWVFPDPTSALTWGPFSLGSTGSCAGDVALTPLQVGTENTPESRIAFTDPSQGSNQIDNVLFAKPENIRAPGGQPILAGTISARFFIADWGSVVEAATSLWHEIIPPTTPFNDGEIPAGSPAHGDPSRNDIHFKWRVPDAERCDYMPDPSPSCVQPGRRHQCMLVQLSSRGAGPQLVFRNQSVYRNMDFVSTMSPFTRAADVSVVGLDSVEDRPKRDVFLYIETHNLPAWSTSTSPFENTVIVAGKDRRIVARRDTTLAFEWGSVHLRRGDTAVVSTKDTMFISRKASMKGGSTTVRAAAAAGRLTEDNLDSLMPTYRVHAYHATGDSITLNGVRRAVLEPQTSFGYWVIHDGDIVGWRHKLKGDSIVRLGPQYYKIAVPNNGFATVTTTIEAIEPKPFALSLHGGVSLPHGNLKNGVHSGFGVTADLERRVNRTFTVAVLFGFQRFDSVGTSGHLNVQHLSGSLVMTLGSGRLRYIFDGGAGSYRFTNGPTKPGAHAGLGVELQITPYLGLGAHYRLHHVYDGSSTNFSTIQIGGRARF